MSRIHDALKKAEQEREAARAEGVPPAADAEQPGSEAAAPAGPHVVEDLQATHSVEALIARCSQPTWNPEPKIAQLFTSANASAVSEELRTLRSRLYQIRERQPLRTLLITSALPAEGKTFLAASLGQTIVRQHERRALVIDADLRHSQLHAALGAPAAPGLTEYLTGSVDEFSIVQRGMGQNLFLIAGGKTASNPAELLANGRLKLLLERLAPVFDWILIDSPPVVPVHDASLLAGMCDGVLLVVRAAETPFDLAQKARAELQDKGLLGVVLNQVEEGQTYHSYYYHYYGKNGAGSKKRK
jgi:protein-tyrosine kinase